MKRVFYDLLGIIARTEDARSIGLIDGETDILEGIPFRASYTSEYEKILGITLILTLDRSDISEEDTSSFLQWNRCLEKIKTSTIFPFDTEVIFLRADGVVAYRLISIIRLDDTRDSPE